MRLTDAEGDTSMTTFPLYYFGWARHPDDDKIRLVRVTVAAPMARTTQEWVEMATTYRRDRDAAAEVARRNKDL